MIYTHAAIEQLCRSIAVERVSESDRTAVDRAASQDIMFFFLTGVASLVWQIYNMVDSDGAERCSKRAVDLVLDSQATGALFDAGFENEAREQLLAVLSHLNELLGPVAASPLNLDNQQDRGFLATLLDGHPETLCFEDDAYAGHQIPLVILAEAVVTAIASWNRLTPRCGLARRIDRSFHLPLALGIADVLEFGATALKSLEREGKPEVPLHLLPDIPAVER